MVVESLGKVLGICHVLVKLMYSLNLKLATVSMDVFQRYSDLRCGPQVWGFCAKSEHNMPMSFPHVGHIIGYDLAIRKFVRNSMIAGADFQTALGAALANSDLRAQNFTASFSAEAGTQRSLAMIAPGITEQYGTMPRSLGQKRAAPGDDDGHQGTGTSKAAKKKARKAEAKAKADAEAAAKAKADARAARRGTRGQRGV